jgi:hypothetical protein
MNDGPENIKHDKRQNQLEKIRAGDFKELSTLAYLLTSQGRRCIEHHVIIEHLYKHFGTNKEEATNIFQQMFEEGYFAKVGDDDYELGPIVIENAKNENENENNANKSKEI